MPLGALPERRRRGGRPQPAPSGAGACRRRTYPRAPEGRLPRPRSRSIAFASRSTVRVGGPYHAASRPLKTRELPGTLGGSPAEQQPSAHRALALHLDDAAVLENVAIAE